MAVLITTGTTFVGQALIIIFLVDAHMQGMSTLAVEIFLGSSGAGGALGSLAAPWLFAQFRYVLLQIQVVMWAVTFAFLACLVVVADRPFIGMTTATGILGFAGALGNVAISTYFVRHSPGPVLAQVISIDRLTSLGALALGPLAGGLAAQSLGAREAMLMLSFVAIAMAVAVSGVMIRMVRERPAGTKLGTAGDWAAAVLDRRPVLSRRTGGPAAPGHRGTSFAPALAEPSQYGQAVDSLDYGSRIGIDVAGESARNVSPAVVPVAGPRPEGKEEG
jgi:MFS family permease